MRTELLDDLREALNGIDRPGAFCVADSAAAVLPGLVVDQLGPVGLPLTSAQAKELAKCCEQAPYGKGTKTVVDTKVRRVWRLGPDRFSLTNPAWNGFLKETVRKVQEELGLEDQTLESHLYDLLLYERGSFFLPHRDGEKLDRMVATLVIVLPSSYEGGEIVVRHEGEERTFDFAGAENSAFQLHFAAFYADCEHEVRPLRKGYRLCLVYNLTLAKSKKKTIAAPRVSGHIEAVSTLLGEWSADEDAEKLVVTLDHQYTEGGLSWDALKGVDRVKARVLNEAALRSGCNAYLALLTFWESGSAEDDGSRSRYRSRRRWDEDEDEDDEEIAGEYTMEEVYETSLTADHLSDAEGNSLPIGKVSVDKEDLLEPDALQAVKPQESFEGYTGNEGMTLERWYRHAAIVLWPASRHFEVLCDRDSRSVVPVLSRMVTSWGQAGAKDKDAAILRTQSIELATAILAKWGGRRPSYSAREEPVTGDLLGTLAALEEPQLIQSYLTNAMVNDAAVDPGSSLVALCGRLGWETFRQDLRTLMDGTTSATVGRNVGLLEQFCSAKPRKKQGWSALCETLAEGLLSAMERIDRAPSTSTDWSAPKVDRAAVLGGMVRALVVGEQSERLSRFVAHVLATPKVYPLKPVQVSALTELRPWLKKVVKSPSAPLAKWVAAAREKLEALTAREPKEPTDFRRVAAVSCKCADCDALKRFLQDPRAPEHRFSARQELRNHLENQIRHHECDIVCRTERKGSPHTLVCTKTQASYQAKLKTYHEDLEHLAMVRAIEDALPR